MIKNDLITINKDGTTKANKVDSKGNALMTLSPSGCNDMAMCSMKFKFLRVEKLPSKQAMPLIQGNAMHDGYEFMMEKKAAGESFEIDDIFKSKIFIDKEKTISKTFDEAWFAHEGANWADMVPTKEKLVEVKEVLTKSFEGFQRNWYDKLDPVFTEPLMVSPVPGGEKHNLHALGFIDLGAIMDKEFYLIDHKSTSNMPKPDKLTGEYPVNADYRQQLAAYSAMVWNWKLPDGIQQCGLLYTSKSKNPEHIFVPVEITQREVDSLAKKMCNYAEIIKNDLFTYNRSHRLCSAKFCSFYGECHDRFGG
jgi:hypothetical protein